MRVFAVPFVLALAAVVGACARTDVLAPAPPGVRLVLVPSSTRIDPGARLQLDASLLVPGQSPALPEVTWTLTPADVGTLSPTGLYEAPGFLKEGVERLAVEITASAVGHPDLVARASIEIAPPPIGPPAALERVVGEDQTVMAGTRPLAALYARVVDATRRGVAGVEVTFAAEGEGGETISSVTDAGGYAFASPLVARRPGPSSVVASSQGLEPVTFPIRVITGNIERIVAEHPTFRAVVGQPLESPVLLRFEDAFANPLPGRRFTTFAPGRATATPLAEASGPDGVLAVRLTADDVAGRQRFLFADALAPQVSATVTLDVRGGPAAALVVVSGNGQQVRAGAELDKELVVRLEDAGAQPAGTGTLRWIAPEGAELLEADSVPRVDGTAHARLVAPRRAGLTSVVVEVPGVAGAPATFLVSVRPGPAARLLLDGGSDQVAGRGGKFPAAFGVRVTDAFLNGVVNVPVSFEAVDGGGSVLVAAARTDGAGLAQSELVAGQAEAQRFRASSTGLQGSPVELRLGAVEPAGDVISIVAGNNQAGRAGRDLATPLTVRVTNRGAPVAGRVVHFGVLRGDGLVRPSPVVTASDGVAAASARLGPVSGQYRYGAAVVGGAPVTFEAAASGRAVALLRVVARGALAGLPGSTLPITIEVLDDEGLGLPGIPIGTTASGDATIGGPGMSGGGGRALHQATLGAEPGEYAFTFVADGGVSLTVRAYAVP